MKQGDYGDFMERKSILLGQIYWKAKLISLHRRKVRNT